MKAVPVVVGLDARAGTHLTSQIVDIASAKGAVLDEFPERSYPCSLIQETLYRGVWKG